MTYGLDWSGRRDAGDVLLDLGSRSLVTDVERSSGTSEVGPAGRCPDRLSDLFVEGDNLEAMELLRRRGLQAKMLYLDPPYNTGNSYAYNDSFASDVDERGTTPGDRAHAAWLSMIHPRLVLSRELLREDGVAFVSIDDTEVANLRLLMDEVYGREHFVSILHWKKRGTGGQHAHHAIINQIEYVLCYAKDRPTLRLSGPQSPRAGEHRWRDFRKSGGQWQRRFRPKQHFALWADEAGRLELEAFDGALPVYPQDASGEDGFWENGVPTTAERLRAGELRARVIRGRWKIEQLEVAKATMSAGNLIDIPSSLGKRRLADLLGAAVFENPKPVELIEHLLDLADPAAGDVVLDPFAGSCTTADAVIRWRASRHRDVQFVMINSPEKVRPGCEADVRGYPTVSEIGLARIAAARAADNQAQTSPLTVMTLSEPVPGIG